MNDLEFTGEPEHDSRILTERAYDRLIPVHCIESLVGYILRGQPTGHFLTALLCNDLRETFARADDANAAAIKNYMVFLYNDVPGLCRGSYEIMKAWRATGGLHGKATDNGRGK